MDALKKTEKELDEASAVAMQLGFYRTILVLNTDYGFKKLRIERFLDHAADVYKECRGDGSKSLIQMCDDETGIEVRNDHGESYLDTTYLCQEKWDREKARFDRMPAAMQRSYYISVRQHMKKWMYAQVMASIILALYRKEGWGIGRIQEFLNKHDVVKGKYDSIEEIKAAVEEATKMQYVFDGDNLCLVGDDKKKVVTG